MIETPTFQQTSESMDSLSTGSEAAKKIKSEKRKELLQEIEATMTLRTDLKTRIDTIINSIAQNQSLFTRAALFWGNLSLWQKIGLGTLLITPTLALGIAIELSIFIVISVLTLISFVASSFILDNHFDHDEQVHEHLKNTMNTLSDALKNSIESLTSLNNELTNEIETLEKENEELNLHVLNLESELSVLSQKSLELVSTENKLKATQTDLEKTTETLTISAEEHNKLVLINRTELDQIAQAINNTHLEMSKKIAELRQVKKDLGFEIDNAKETSTILHRSVICLSRAIMDEKHQVLFQDKLKEFLLNSENSFDEVAKRISNAESELSLVKEQLNQSNLRYQLLLDREDFVMEQLERNTFVPPVYNANPLLQNHSSALNKFGLHADKKIDPVLASELGKNPITNYTLPV